MKCPKCGEELDPDIDIAIDSISEKQIKVWHVDLVCDGKWIYKRKG